MVSEFGNVLKNSLRKSDIIIQWRQNLFFAVMPLLSADHISSVTERIMETWKESGYNERIEVKHTVSTSISPVLAREQKERVKFS